MQCLCQADGQERRRKIRRGLVFFCCPHQDTAWQQHSSYRKTEKTNTDVLFVPHSACHVKASSTTTYTHCVYVLHTHTHRRTYAHTHPVQINTITQEGGLFLSWTVLRLASNCSFTESPATNEPNHQQQSNKTTEHQNNLTTNHQNNDKTSKQLNNKPSEQQNIRGLLHESKIRH